MKPFHDRDVRIVLGASALSALGDLIAMIALTVRVHDSTRSGFAVAALVLCSILPMTVFAPVTGWVVDRFETVRVMVVTALAQALLVSALAFVQSFPLLLVLALGLGAGVAITRPAVFALLPRMVDKERLTELNAWFQAAYFGGAALGPVAGGFLIAHGGVRLALMVDAATFLVFAVAGLSLRVRRPAGPAAAGEGGGRAEFGRGVGVLARDRTLLLAVALFGCSILFVAGTNVAEVFLVKDALGGGNIAYGLLNGAWAAGMVVGATVLARRLRNDRLMPALLVACAVTGAAVLAAGGAPVLAVALAAYVAGGCANGLQNVVVRTLIQQRAPGDLHGRVYAVYAGIASTADVGSSGLGGLLVTIAGGRSAMVLAGSLALLATAAGTVAHWRLAGRSHPAAEMGTARSTPP